MYKGKDWKYAYDGLNRMTDAVYDDATGGRNHYNETVSYNANGSALTIKRNGRNDAGNYTAIDNLTLIYIGNRLLRVTDKGDACTSTGATDFNDGANIAVEYTYDACGARTSDANKGIAGIQYSYWGTPELIQFTNGSQTRYVYDASGVKQKRIHITAVDNIVVPLKTVMELSDDQILTSDTTEYLWNLVFENGRLDKVLFSSGYVSCSNDNNQERFTFHYFVKDHLGNNRAVVNESGAIEQTTHYYPFGNSIADIGTNTSIQQYKYNGKELDRMHGLDWYDYGARNYDPVILQWDRPDLLAEKYYPVSPYVYCHDNPVSLFDVNGMDDLFDEYGLFIKRTEKGSSIMIRYGDGYKNIVDVDFSNNYEAIENIGRHYLLKSDKGKFTLRVSKTGDGISKDAFFSHVIGTDKYDIYLTDGYVNPSLGDYNDFECVTYHESVHRYNSAAGKSPSGELEAIIQTTECDAWSKATDNYIGSQASYAKKQLENIKSPLDLNNYLKKINSAFCGYAEFSNVNNQIQVVNLINEIQCIGKLKK